MAAAKAKNAPSHKRVKTPTVLQMEAVECGAAALAIVLGYYGRIVPLEELRVACGVSRDGTKAGNVLKAAREYGLKSKGFSKQPDSLKEMKLPLVVFWNFSHFLVVEGFAKDKVYLNDPAMGPRTVTWSEFSEAFTGVVLAFEPGPDFKPGGKKRGLWAILRTRLEGSEVGLGYVIIASLCLALIGLIIPIFSKFFVDYILATRFSEWLYPLLIGMALTAVLRIGFTWLEHYYLLKLSTKLTVTSSYVFLRHLLHLPMEFFTQRYGGEVGARVEINDKLSELLSGQLAANALNLLMAFLYVILMFCFDLVLTLVGLTIAVLNFVALQYVSRARKDINVRLLSERGKMMGTTMSGLQAIETLKATGGEADFFSRWSGSMAKVMVSSQRMDLLSRGLGAVPSFLSVLGTVAILGVGALRIMSGDMTIGTLVAFQALMMGFMQPVIALVNLGSTLQQTEGELNRLDDVLRYAEDESITGGAHPRVFGKSLGCGTNGAPPKLTGLVEMRNITFGYSRMDKPLITDFNLTVQPGSRVALVGFSASGKSTLSKIVTGLYRPWEGEILFDGMSRDDIPRDTIANSLALVDQEFFLYEGTLRDVLTMWDPTIPEEAIIQAAKDACIHEDIAARPNGYDSILEEGGRNFSRGQRQRLEIARALVGNPSILVLDEATSALDPVTEQQIDENLRRRGCTCIIVAHRLSTIRDCDEIIVLDWGEVMQRGTHEELNESQGIYRELISTT
jgi:NHLM bacteriocin system ABC transporter peptidase/ATP-binding protein